MKTFDEEMEFAMSRGLTATQAMECIAFMNRCFPEDIDLRTTYYTHDWMKRWQNVPRCYMDPDCRAIYDYVVDLISIFKEVLRDRDNR